MDQTPEQKKAVQQATGFTIGADPVTPPVYNKNNLTAPAPVTVPTPTPVSTPESMVGSMDSSLSSIESDLKGLQAPSQAESDQNTLRQKVLDSMKGLSEKGARTTALEADKGLPAMQTQLQDISGQLLALKNDSVAIPLKIQEQFKGTGATTGGAEPIQASQLRQNAIKSLSLSAIGQAIQGNIALAQSQVDRAVALEFEPKQQQLDYLTKLLEFNQTDLSRADKKKADQMQILLSERERILNQEKQDRTNILNTVLEAARSGADQATLEKIRNSSSPDQAVANAGGFLGAEYQNKLKQQKFDNEIKLRNAALDDAKYQLDKNKFAFEKSQKTEDISNGVLTEAQIKAIDASPQGKSLSALGNLKLKLGQYRKLVDKYGTSSYGTQKAELDAVYNDLKIAYKDAAQLGALTGPDSALIEGAIRSATYGNPISQAFAKLTGDGLDSIKSGLSRAEQTLDSTASTEINQLLARNPLYSNSSYVKSMVLPFIKPTQTTAETAQRTYVPINGKSVLVGSIIQNASGKQFRVDANGNLIPVQ